MDRLIHKLESSNNMFVLTKCDCVNMPLFLTELNKYGYQPYSESSHNNDYHTYVLLTQRNKHDYLNLINSPDNADGKLIKVVICSPSDFI